MMGYWAQNVEDESEFYLFWTEAKRDAFIRKHSDESWKFGRLINGEEKTDGFA